MEPPSPLLLRVALPLPHHLPHRSSPFHPPRRPRSASHVTHVSSRGHSSHFSHCKYVTHARRRLEFTSHVEEGTSRWDINFCQSNREKCGSIKAGWSVASRRRSRWRREMDGVAGCLEDASGEVWVASRACRNLFVILLRS
ncbi:hypothetical protein M758_11G092800 [Ceratodon purpureus]|nr:hypothetical protein M758_11G092800 [Ceratodon purpureus]